MALDPIGISTIIPSAQVATGNLQTEPQEQVQQAASQLETGTQTSPVVAQAQVQGALQADQQQQNADSQRQDRAARDNDRGERVDIEA
jgi:hypothetical protein